MEQHVLQISYAVAFDLHGAILPKVYLNGPECFLCFNNVRGIGRPVGDHTNFSHVVDP